MSSQSGIEEPTSPSADKLASPSADESVWPSAHEADSEFVWRPVDEPEPEPEGLFTDVLWDWNFDQNGYIRTPEEQAAENFWDVETQKEWLEWYYERFPWQRKQTETPGDAEAPAERAWYQTVLDSWNSDLCTLEEHAEQEFSGRKGMQPFLEWFKEYSCDVLTEPQQPKILGGRDAKDGELGEETVPEGCYQAIEIVLL